MKSIIDTRTINFEFDKWYRITVILDFNNFKLFIQNDKIRQHKLIFKKQILELNRGTLAFATNGNSNFYINGITIDKDNLNKKSDFKDNKRSWQRLLKLLSLRERKIYCRELFDNQLDEIHRCMELRFYCQIKCDNIIPREENILNFACFNDCVRSSNQVKNYALLPIVKSVSKTNVWIPKPHDKCDFKPYGNNFFRMCVIKKVTVTASPDKYIVEVLYRDYDRNILMAQVKFPGPELFQCGTVLSKRNDCFLVTKKRNKYKKTIN